MSEPARDYTHEIERAEAMMREARPQETITILESVLPGIADKDARYRADIYSKLGTAYAMCKRHKEAVGLFLKAIEIDETLVKAYQNACLSYTYLNEIEKAVEWGEKGLKHGPESSDLLKVLLTAKRIAWQVDESLALMEKSPAFDRQDPFLLMNYGTLLYETGQKKESHDIFAKVIELTPDQVKAHRMFSLVHRYTEDDPYFAKHHSLEKIKAYAGEEAAEINFTLGKAYEDIKDYGTAFKYYKQGKDQMRTLHPFSSDVEANFFQQIKNVFTPEYIEELCKNSNMPDASVVPIFIIGMPRSGTSLTEQILSSHSDVYGAGELRDLDLLQYEEFSLRRSDFENTWWNVSESELKQIAKIYIERLAKDSNGEGFIVDKMPLNFIHCGVIRYVLPNAKIIHCKRDPRATCFSNYKTFFSSAVPFANNQKDLADYYELYRGMIEHWRAVMPGFMYEVQYEDLVDDPEEHIRALLEYCGLEWQDACLDFHKTKRAVVTASAMQVKKPMYKDALAYWKNFEPYLDPAIKGLKAW